jgi:hypothetical protein
MNDPVIPVVAPDAARPALTQRTCPKPTAVSGNVLAFSTKRRVEAN